jgi:hypothetical protein
MFNFRYNQVLGIGAILSMYGLYNYTCNKNINIKTKPKEDNNNIICYSNCDDDIANNNFSEYDDSSDSDSSEDFNLRSYALTEYEYY